LRHKYEPFGHKSRCFECQFGLATLMPWRSTGLTALHLSAVGHLGLSSDASMLEVTALPLRFLCATHSLRSCISTLSTSTFHSHRLRGICGLDVAPWEVARQLGVSWARLHDLNAPSRNNITAPGCSKQQCSNTDKHTACLSKHHRQADETREGVRITTNQTLKYGSWTQ
jgi:hypothetical protein